MSIILAYHPRVTINGVIITGDLNDYYSETEILESVKTKGFKCFQDVINYLKNYERLKLPEGELYIER